MSVSTPMIVRKLRVKRRHGAIAFWHGTLMPLQGVWLRRTSVAKLIAESDELTATPSQDGEAILVDWIKVGQDLLKAADSVEHE